MIDTRWQQYRRKQNGECRPYQNGEDMTGINVADHAREAGSPKEGDMIARDPNNHIDQWLITADYFEQNLELI